MSEDIGLNEFDDWLEENFGEIAWDDDGNELNDHQKDIVTRNVALITDKEKWTVKVDRFQAIVDAQAGEEAKKKLLKRYAIHFDFAKFDINKGFIDFSGLVFPVAVYFTRADFIGGHANFLKAQFMGGDTSFTAANFRGGKANFKEATFFEGCTSFFNTSFIGGDADFSWAQFCGSDAIFWSAEFRDNNAIFIECSFKSRFILESNQCRELVFLGSVFDGRTTIAVERCNGIPDFRECKFDRPPNLSLIKITEKPRVDRFLLNTDQVLVDKWRVLKNLANEAGDHEKAGQFFANEMAAKRGTEITGFWPIFFSGTYYAFSNFGQSYFRASAWLAFFGTFFATLYYVLLPNALAGWDRILFSVEYSLRNLIPFLGSLFRFSARPVTEGFATGFEKNLSLINEAHGGIDTFIYLGVVEQLIGGILFFLLLLGLRNVFRMK